MADAFDERAEGAGGEPAGPWVDASLALKRNAVLSYGLFSAAALGLAAFWLFVADGDERIVGLILLAGGAIGVAGTAHQWWIYRRDRRWVRALAGGLRVADRAGTRVVPDRDIRRAEVTVQPLSRGAGRVCSVRLVVAAGDGEANLHLAYVYRPTAADPPAGDPLAAVWGRLGNRASVQRVQLGPNPVVWG
jgi:hypothetical protein